MAREVFAGRLRGTSPGFSPSVAGPPPGTRAEARSFGHVSHGRTPAEAVGQRLAHGEPRRLGHRISAATDRRTPRAAPAGLLNTSRATHGGSPCGDPFGSGERRCGRQPAAAEFDTLVVWKQARPNRSRRAGQGGIPRYSIAALCCYRPGEPARLIYRPRRHRKHRGTGRNSFARTDCRDLIVRAHIQLKVPIVLSDRAALPGSPAYTALRADRQVIPVREPPAVRRQAAASSPRAFRALPSAVRCSSPERGG